MHLPIILLGPYSDELIDSVTPQHNDYIFTPPKARGLRRRHTHTRRTEVPVASHLFAPPPPPPLLAERSYRRRPCPQGKDLLTRVACQLKLHDTMKLDAEASLLRRVLPSEIIARMQAGKDEFIADAHENLTFLFADLVSFTEMCSVTPTTEVVSFLNELFTRFDSHVDRHGVYKVDIIG